MSAFTYASLETGEVIETDDVLVFWAYLRAKAERDITQWHDSRSAAVVERHSSGLLKGTLDIIESQARLSPSIDGRNAEVREAQVAEVLRQDAQWVETKAMLRENDERVALHEVDADAAQARWRMVLRDLEVMAAIYSPSEERTRGQ